jgi:hypothetical protein
MSLALSAQSLVSFGGRGGFDFMVPGTKQTLHSKFGVAGAVDIGYTYYWHIGALNGLGIHTGISAGYATSDCEIEFNQQYTNYDYLNNELQYTTTGKTGISMKRAYAEVPLMVAFRSNKNIIAQLGLKVQYAFKSSITQQTKEATIDAYFPAYDIHITDQLITGRITEEDKNGRILEGSAPTWNLVLAMRAGYEFRFNKKHIVGIAAYLDFNLWNNLSFPQIDQPHIAVAPITDPVSPVPAVTVNNAFSTVISRINPIQIGVSVYYALEYRLYKSFKSSEWEDL